MAGRVNKWNELLAFKKIWTGDPPKDFQTIQQIAKEVGMSVPQTSRRVRDAFDGGSVEMRMYRVWTARGLYPVPHYRRK
jgi:cell wall assembly regulator SMI1